MSFHTNFLKKYNICTMLSATVILFLLLINYVSAFPQPNGGVVAAASAANHIDNQRFPRPDNVAVSNRRPVLRPPQRRQSQYYYQRPESTLSWFRQYFLPQAWRFLGIS